MALAAGAALGHATDVLRGEEAEGVDPEGEAALYALELEPSDDEALHPGLDEDATFAYGPVADPEEYEPMDRLPEASVDPEGEAALDELSSSDGEDQWPALAAAEMMHAHQEQELWHMQFNLQHHPHHHPGHYLPQHGFALAPPLWPPPWPLHAGHFHHPPHLDQAIHNVFHPSFHAPPLGPPPPWLWALHPGHHHHPHHHPGHHNGFAFAPPTPPFPWVEVEVVYTSHQEMWSDPHFRYLDPHGLDEDPTLDDPELVDERDSEDNSDLVTARARLDDKFW